MLGEDDPWMEQGIPSKKGITLARSARADINLTAPATSSPRTQRSPSAPRCSRGEHRPPTPYPTPDPDVGPQPRARDHWRARFPRRPGPTRSGPHKASTTVLSSRPTHSGRRYARQRRPPTSDNSLRKVATTSASPVGSNRSTAARAGPGRSAKRFWAARIPSTIVADLGTSKASHSASSAVGSGLELRSSDPSANTRDAPHRCTSRTKGTSPVTGAPVTMTGRPAISGPGSSQ
jgi:hypothetical protein